MGKMTKISMIAAMAFSSAVIADDKDTSSAEKLNYEQKVVSDYAQLDGYVQTGEVFSSISYRGIYDTEVLDPETVLFWVRGAKAYVSRLDSVCHQLSPEDHGFYIIRDQRSYVTSLDSVRSTDTKYNPAGKCQLGQFVEFRKGTQDDTDAREIDDAEAVDAALTYAQKVVSDYEDLKGYEQTGKVFSAIARTGIYETAVLDPETVLFWVRGSKAYVNRLAGYCHSLSSRDTDFNYSSRMGFVSSNDTIRVGTSEYNSSRCQLGQFVEFEKSDDKKKKSKKDKRAKELAALTPFAEHDALKKYEATGKVTRGININRIQRTQILDDYTIVFFMRGKQAYVNRMKYKCPSLKSEDRFVYETFAGRLSSLDTISVLDSFGRKWASCGLGKFTEFKRKEESD